MFEFKENIFHSVQNNYVHAILPFFTFFQQFISPFCIIFGCQKFPSQLFASVRAKILLAHLKKKGNIPHGMCQITPKI
jgi:hypothetical protein